MVRSVLVTLVCAALAGCAGSATPSAQGGTPAPQQSRANGEVITTQELAAASSYDLYAAIQRLRPSFLQGRGATSFGSTSSGSDEIQVYVEGMHRGGLSTLREINAGDVAEVRRLSAAEATQRFGTGTPQGAILVTLKR